MRISTVSGTIGLIHRRARRDILISEGCGHRVVTGRPLVGWSSKRKWKKKTLEKNEWLNFCCRPSTIQYTGSGPAYGMITIQVSQSAWLAATGSCAKVMLSMWRLVATATPINDNNNKALAHFQKMLTIYSKISLFMDVVE
ncbi:hypothetical protein T05_3823 [Trichinella murrelli]|uniref:Uncharacterized protein n=1 Tax=Trichinella murrelli TaxID=144512 RepID=A0A0V0U201_9BILA|nr:hypothetical protein T05_3823 [Trichinella murrelli]